MECYLDRIFTGAGWLFDQAERNNVLPQLVVVLIHARQPFGFIAEKIVHMLIVVLFDLLSSPGIVVPDILVIWLVLAGHDVP